MTLKKFFLLFLLLGLAGSAVADTPAQPQPQAPGIVTAPPGPSPASPGNPPAGAPLPPSGPTVTPVPVLTPVVTGSSSLSFSFLEGWRAGFGFSQYYLFNAQPLAYSISVSYEFPNGIRLGSAWDTFFYEGDALDSGGNLASFSYSGNNWSILAAYEFNAGGSLRPLAGLQTEIFSTQRSLKDVHGAPTQAADSFVGLSPVLGLNWRFQRNWELLLTARYIFTFTSFQNPPVVGLGINYIW